MEIIVNKTILYIWNMLRGQILIKASCHKKKKGKKENGNYVYVEVMDIITSLWWFHNAYISKHQAVYLKHRQHYEINYLKYAG